MSSLSDLTAAFAPVNRGDWEALARKTFEGAAPLALDQILFTAGDAEPAAFSRAPREAERPWLLRALADDADPAAANAHILDDLRGGAASVLLLVGSDGLRADGAGAIEAALAGVMMELAPVALDAGFGGPWAADALAAAARRAPRARLAFHLDPLGAFARTGASPGPLASHLARAARTAVGHAAAYPLASMFLANGRAAHEAGAGDSRELAMMAAAVVAYVRALTEAGLPADAAFAGVVLGVSVDGAPMEAIAKLRAARLIWRQLTAACGVRAPATIEARASRRMLSSLDVWTNLLRLTAAGMAAALGGADAVVLERFTQPLGPPTPLARRQARNIQLVAMEEAFLGRVEDPARGAWFVEARSRKLASRAWREFQAIEAHGGLAAALKSGAIAEAVSAERLARQARFDAGDDKLVGVNLYRAQDAAPPSVAAHAEAPDGLEAAALAGPDDACPPLSPHRWAETFEQGTAP